MNSGKPQLSFLLQFPTSVEAFARVKELGAVKYDRDNWKLGGKPDWEYLDACLRHIMAFMSGEYYAEDTGCSHLAHAAWNLFALQDLNYRGQTHDPEQFAKMYREWAGKREDSEPKPDVQFIIEDAEKIPSMKAIDETFADMCKAAAVLQTLRETSS